LIPIELDRSNSVSLQEQLYRVLRDRILEGQLEPGFALPPTRDLAIRLGVSRNTVLQAYDWLASEGFIDGRRGSGSYVSRLASVATPFRRPGVKSEIADGPTKPVEFDFWYGRVDSRLFPLAFWRATAGRLLASKGHGLAEYGPAAGDLQLRRALVRHIAVTRGIEAQIEQVIITQGAQQALNLAARLVIPNGGLIGMESPGYSIAAEIFQLAGASLLPLSVDESGIDVGSASGRHPSAVYVTPSHQFPTGVTLSLERRRALIDWCRESRAWLIEDDYDGEIVYDRPPLMAISAIDPRRSFYVGSFSKVLGSGLRIGYLIVPADFSRRAAELKKLMSYGQGWLDQRILGEFLASGHFDRHVRRLRKLYRSRRDNMFTLVSGWLGSSAAYMAANSGAHIYCRFSDRSQVSAARLAESALAENMRLYAGRDAGIWAPNDGSANALLIGYAAYTPEEAASAFERLASVKSSIGAVETPSSGS
jgi:GntR family transcriptional regulator / MocR family aminotransferase